jgi:hypothetical protein
MNHISHGTIVGMLALALTACNSKTPTTEDNILKGQVQSMEKAKQVEGMMQQRVDSLNQRMDNQER